MVRWLRDQGLEASSFATEYGEEDDGLVGAVGGPVAASAQAAQHIAASISGEEAARIVVAPADSPADDAGA